MPFKSKAQQRFMFAAEDRGEVPKGTAGEWARASEKKPGGIKALPEKVKQTKTAGEMAEGALSDSKDKGSFITRHPNVAKLLGAAAVGGTLGVGHGLLKARAAKKLMQSQMPKVVAAFPNKIAGEMDDLEATLRRSMGGTVPKVDTASYVKPRYMGAASMRRARIGLGLGAAGVAAYGLHSALKKKNEPKTAGETDDIFTRLQQQNDRSATLRDTAGIKAKPSTKVPAHMRKSFTETYSHLVSPKNLRRAGIGAAALGAAGLGAYGLHRALKKDAPKTAGDIAEEVVNDRTHPALIGGLGLVPGYGLLLAAAGSSMGAPEGQRRRAVGQTLVGGIGGAAGGAGLGALIGNMLGHGMSGAEIGSILGIGLGAGLGYHDATRNRVKEASSLADSILAKKK